MTPYPFPPFPCRSLSLLHLGLKAVPRALSISVANFHTQFLYAHTLVDVPYHPPSLHKVLLKRRCEDILRFGSLTCAACVLFLMGFDNPFDDDATTTSMMF